MTINHRPYDLISLDDDIGPRFLNSQDRQSSDPSAFDAFSTSPATQASATLLDTPYLLEPGDSTAISVNDINQGQIGDCFLLASIGELALFHPTAITSMIHSNANDTETVTLYTASNGQLPSVNTSAFAPVNVSVTNSFPDYSVNNGVNQDVVGDLKEIWPQVLEKAVATLDGGYSAIMDGGSPLVAMEELTGQSATYMSPAALTLAELNSFVSAFGSRLTSRCSEPVLKASSALRHRAVVRWNRECNIRQETVQNLGVNNLPLLLASDRPG
jgi:hypothetical protein